MFQVVGIGTQFTEALAGSTAPRKCCREAGGRRAEARNRIGPIQGDVDFDHVDFAYDPGKPVLREVSFHPSRHGDGAGGTIGLGEIHDHQPDRGVPRSDAGVVRVDGGTLC